MCGFERMMRQLTGYQLLTAPPRIPNMGFREGLGFSGAVSSRRSIAGVFGGSTGRTRQQENPETFKKNVRSLGSVDAFQWDRAANQLAPRRHADIGNSGAGDGSGRVGQCVTSAAKSLG